MNERHVRLTIGENGEVTAIGPAPKEEPREVPRPADPETPAAEAKSCSR